MDKPYINQYEELVIPFNSHPTYHWWAGGMSIIETLNELNAPEEIKQGYEGN